MNRFLMVLLVGLLSLCFVSATPVAYFNAEVDSGFGFAVDNWNGHNGTFYNVSFSSSTPVFNLSGGGGSYSYNLSDYGGSMIVFDSLSAFDFSTASDSQTISVWVRGFNKSELGWLLMKDAGTAGTVEYRIMSSNCAGGEGWVYQYGDYVGGAVGCDASVNRSDGGWHHLVATSSPSTLKIYYDGVLLDSVARSNTRSSPYALVLGGRDKGGGVYQRSFKGLVDELKIYRGFEANQSHVSNLFNFGGLNASSPAFLNVSAFDLVGGSSVDVFNVSVDGSVFSTSNGSVFVPYYDNNEVLDLVVSSANRFNVNFVDLNFSQVSEDGNLSVNFSVFPLFGLFNRWNGSGLVDWNVTVVEGGLTFSDGGLGFVYLPYNVSGLSLNFSKDNYISRLVVNDSLPDSVVNNSLWGSVVEFRAFERVSNVFLNYSAPSAEYWYIDDLSHKVEDGGLLTLYLNKGNVSVDWVNTMGYFNQELSLELVDDLEFVNVSAFDSMVNFSVFNFSSDVLVPSNLSGNVSSGVWSESFWVLENTSFNLTKGLNYSFYVNGSPVYTDVDPLNTKIIFHNDTYASYNISLFRRNSLLVSFSDLLTGESVVGVDLLLLGSSTYDFFVNSSVGYVPSLVAGSFDLLGNKSGFSDYSSSMVISEGLVTNVSAAIASSASDVSIFVRNIFDQYLSNVSVVITRQSDGSVVASGFTDSSGGLKVGLSDRLTYNVVFFKSGFENLSGTIRVADSSYTFTMKEEGVDAPSLYEGFEYFFSPSLSLLVNASLYNFSGGFNSSVYNVSSVQVFFYDGNVLSNGSSLLFEGNVSFTSSSGSWLVSGFNSSLLSGGLLSVQLLFVVDGSQSFSVYQFYGLDDLFEGDASLMVALSRLASFDKAGFGDVERTWLFLFFVVGVVSGLASVSTLLDDEKFLLLLTALVSLGSFLGFLTLDFVAVDGGWFLAVFLGFLSLLSVVRVWRDK